MTLRYWCDALTDSAVKPLTFGAGHLWVLRTFAPKSSYGEIFFISRLELVDKVLTPKMKKKMGVTDFVSEKMAVENALISINRS